MPKKLAAAKETPGVPVAAKAARPNRPAEAKTSSKPAERERASEAARRFKALGEPTRLRIVLFLRGQGSTPDAEDEPSRGVRVTEICRQVTGGEKLSSTFSHHLKELRRAGLIRVERDGKSRWCQLEQTAFDALLPFLAALPIVPPAPENETGGAA